MNSSLRQHGLEWRLGIAYASLVAVLGFLAVRTMGASPFADTPGPALAGAPAGTAAEDLLADLTDPDGLRTDALSDERNPFAFPSRRPTRQSSPPPAQPVEEPKPTLGALLYDTIDPAVQLKIGGGTSPWLKTGDRYRGWTVGEIRPGSVLVQREDERLVLP